jgi:hypothetical protein
VGLAGDRAGEQGLAGAGWPGHQHAARAARSGLVVAARVAQIVDDLADLGLHRGVPGDVGEPGGRPFGVDDPRLRLDHAVQAAHATAHGARVPPDAAKADKDEAGQQQQRQLPGQRGRAGPAETCAS